MIEEQTPPGLVDSEMGPTRSGRRAFNQWLQVQLKAMKLTQRQLAQKSGVDHSTISRLTRGDRAPSLRTATLLTRGLGMAKGLAWLDDQSLGRTGAPAARVEYALRSDDLLSETEVGKIMNVYLATRLRRPRSVATPAPMETTGTTPVPRSSFRSPGCVRVRRPLDDCPPRRVVDRADTAPRQGDTGRAQRRRRLTGPRVNQSTITPTTQAINRRIQYTIASGHARTSAGSGPPL